MGLLRLVRDVRGYLQTNAPELGTTVAFGRKAVTQQLNQGVGRANRVTFVIGDDQGVLGKYIGRQSEGERTTRGGRGRQITTLRAAADVHVWAVDLADKATANDEEAQLEAAWALHDWVLTAIHECADSPYQLGALKLVTTPVERQFGACLRFVLSLDIPVLHQRASAGVVGATPVVSNSLSTRSGAEKSCEMGE